MTNEKKIVLAYSGGLDTSAIIPWLIDSYGAEVIAYCADLGNSPDEEKLREQALSLGACDFVYEDLKNTFVEKFVWPLIRSGAVYQGEYLLGTAIARPLIAERIAFCARECGASAIAHGATGKGNDQIRFERAWAYLVPELEIIAPWKIWKMKGREDLLQYLGKKGHEFQREEKKYSEDTNLLHRSCEGGELEQIGNPLDYETVTSWTTHRDDIPTNSVEIEIVIEHGMPSSLNGEKLPPENILQLLNSIGSQYGIGVVDIVEERTNGIKSRGIYETPGGTILHRALASLKQICWNRNTMDLASYVSQRYAGLTYDGLWYSPERLGLEAFFSEVSKPLCGTIRLLVSNRGIRVLSRKSEFSLYDEKLVSFDSDQYQLNEAANGFCKTLCFSQQLAGKRTGVWRQQCES